MPVPYKVNCFDTTPSGGLTGLKGAFEDALKMDEDARIEIEQPILFTEELDTINHGQTITIASTTEMMYLSSWELSKDDSGKDYSYFRHFCVQRGGLVLENITLCGHDPEAHPNPAPEEIFYGGVEVRSGGTLRIKQDSIIENCKGLSAGGVWVKEGGNFLMTSGEIKNCLTGTPFGNLVYIDGNFQLRDGTLQFTTPHHYNGVHLGEAGSFTMEGGSIENCVSAVYLERGSNFNLEDGTIEQNDTGIDTDHHRGKKIIVMNGGSITGNRIGVHLAEGAEFTLNRGEISEHLGQDGIGVLAAYGNTGSFVMNGGSVHHNVQGLTWQQTGISCEINKGDIYENGYGLAIDNAVATFNGGRIYNNQIYRDEAETPSLNPLEGGYPVSGMGVMVGFNGMLNVNGGEIFSNERIGIAAIFSGHVNVSGGKIYENLIGIRFVCSSGVMNDGEIFENRVAGVEVANFQDDFESEGSTFELKGGLIYQNNPLDPTNPIQKYWGQGVSVKDNSNFVMTGGEIFGHTSYPQGFGVWCRNRSHVNMSNGRIYGNYKAIELGMGLSNDNVPIFEEEPGSTFTMESGQIARNTIGVTVWAGCSFNMENGEISDNTGYSEWVATNGGLGVGVCFGTFTMAGGKIYGHRGFPAVLAKTIFNQPVGAAITILYGGDIILEAGEIFDNVGSVGAAVYVPNEWYGPNPAPEPYTFRQSLVIKKDVHFYNNLATDDQPYIYDGRNSYVEVNIAFGSTSVGAHVLNNYDVNYTSLSGGFRLTSKLRDYFVDECLAQLVGEQINRSLDDYVAPSEFEKITDFNAEGCCIRSIAGIHYLTNLSNLNLNGNQIEDLGHLEDFKGESYQAYDQQITLPQIYVSRPQEFTPYGIDNKPIPVRLFKHNGVFDNETHVVTWWERGRNQMMWGNELTDKFTGVVYQTVIPIPIESLFPHPDIAAEIAKRLNKMVTSPVDVTELLRITHLDLSKQGPFFMHDLEGLQYLSNLRFINLKGSNNLNQTEVETFFKGKVKVKI